MTLLTIRSSVNGDASISNQLVNAYVNARQDQNSQQNNHTADTIINRDLSTDAIPVLTAELTAAIRAGQQDSTAQRDAIALSDTLIDELKNADEIVIGLPRYNFHAPASFKAYIDYIARPRITFQYSENGPEGLLPNVPVTVILTSGGIYPKTEEDGFSQWVIQVLGFLGLHNVRIIRVDGTALDAEQAKADAIAQF